MLEHAHVPPGVGRSKEDGLEKVRRGQMLRAAKGEQLSTRGDEAQSLEIDLFIPGDADLEVLTATDKRWGIKNDEIERLSGFAQVREHIRLDKLALGIGQAIPMPIFSGKS